MAWTYTDPASSNRDWVRFRIGDTISGDPQLSDGEIASLLSDAGDLPRLAALYAAKRLRSKYARLVDNSQGDESNAYSQRQAAYTELIKELEDEIAELGPGGGSGSGGGGGIRATGQSLARRATVRADTDRVQPPAYRGQWSRDDDSEAQE